MAICTLHGYKKSSRDQSHDFWRLELGKVKKYDVFSETQIFVLTNNLRCFDETDVGTSHKTTYAQFKIYRTIFIDETIAMIHVGPCQPVDLVDAVDFLDLSNVSTKSSCQSCHPVNYVDLSNMSIL